MTQGYKRQNYFFEEEFMGCCGICIIFEFPERATKEAIRDFKRKHHGVEEQWGAIVIALTNHQSEWFPVLKEMGYINTLSGVINPNTGNLLFTFSFDCQNEVREEEEDEY